MNKLLTIFVFLGLFFLVSCKHNQVDSPITHKPNFPPLRSNPKKPQDKEISATPNVDKSKNQIKNTKNSTTNDHISNKENKDNNLEMVEQGTTKNTKNSTTNSHISNKENEDNNLEMVEQGTTNTKSLLKGADSKENNTIDSIEKNNARIKAELQNIVNNISSLQTVARDKISDLPATILFKFKDYIQNFSYKTLINPIANIDDNIYSIQLDLSSAKASSTEINNVILKLKFKDNSDVFVQKNISIVWPSKTKDYEISVKKLPDIFKNIFPSILAYALVNVDSEEVFNSRILGDFNFSLENFSFGQDLKNNFLEVKSKTNNHYDFKVLSAKADDQNGSLELEIQITNLDQNLVDNQTFAFKFEGLNHGDQAIEFKINEDKVLQEIKKKQLVEKIKKQSINNFTKPQLNKIFAENLEIYFEQLASVYKLTHFLVKDHLNTNKYLVYPKIIFFDLQNAQNEPITSDFEYKDGYLEYTYKFKTANLSSSFFLYNNLNELLSGNFAEKTVVGKIKID
ncbi:LppA-related lipoprotein [Mesomycoplasma conjunctivae]|uniref:LppA-related lipoprotein n=1 Tax=Mesomycoplasma conjunctivae TaxID=45361 RepID=UPI003DA4B1FE